jgi:8-oxo-dGTP pyrophosphatase MutT (NUDIX family)
MYKIFLNDREIVISSQATEYSGDTEIVNAEGFTIDKIKNWFSEFYQKNNNAILLHPNPEEMITKAFIPAFKVIDAAGGIVIRNSKLLFIFRNEKWDLPKGKIEKGETPEQAAIREVTEECGITGHSIARQLPPTFHIYQSSYKNDFGQWILKKTFWFEMNYSGAEKGTPETGENITEIRWFGKEELHEVLSNTYENLKSTIYHLYF